MEPSLLIMAAGIGSRYGVGIKQLEAVGLHGEIIIDFSIHDAIEAGFKKIIVVLRREIEEDFREAIGRRIEPVCAKRGVEILYAYQELEDFPGEIPEGRKKPWGTGQAVLAARELLHEPFAVINADDYYGKWAFRAFYHFLRGVKEENTYCMAGFTLRNTLSEHGGVTRGLCTVDEYGYLSDIVETTNIRKTAAGAETDDGAIPPDTTVSMNMWGFTPDFLRLLELGFRDFVETELLLDPVGAEYLLPDRIGGLLHAREITVRVLNTPDQWYGVTFREDREPVSAAIRKLIADGRYREDLYSDLV